MAFDKIATTRGRQAQLVKGQGNNLFTRASDFNPIVDFINSILGETTSATANSATGNSVTLNTQSGKITTGTLTTAAGATQAVTLTNSLITTSSNVIAWIEDYSGTLFTNGVPLILKALPSAGSAVITVGNTHAANALNGTLKIKFIIL